MITHECIDTIGAVSSSPRIEWRSWAADGIFLVKRDATALMMLMRTWAHRARSRRALADVDARILADVGLTPGEARREVSKPFWKA